MTDFVPPVSVSHRSLRHSIKVVYQCWTKCSTFAF